MALPPLHDAEQLCEPEQDLLQLPSGPGPQEVVQLPPVWIVAVTVGIRSRPSMNATRSAVIVGVPGPGITEWSAANVRLPRMASAPMPNSSSRVANLRGFTAVSAKRVSRDD